MNNYNYLTKKYGMSVRYWRKLEKIFSFKKADTNCNVLTYAEAIRQGKLEVTGFRWSKKGKYLVTLSNGDERCIEQLEDSYCYSL